MLVWLSRVIMVIKSWTFFSFQTCVSDVTLKSGMKTCERRIFRSFWCYVYRINTVNYDLKNCVAHRHVDHFAFSYNMRKRKCFLFIWQYPESQFQCLLSKYYFRAEFYVWFYYYISIQSFGFQSKAEHLLAKKPTTFIISKQKYFYLLISASATSVVCGVSDRIPVCLSITPSTFIE